MFRFVQKGALHTAFVLMLAILVAPSQAYSAKQETAIIGFPGEASQKQRALEEDFAKRINNKRIRESLRELSSKPHHAGSGRSLEIAQSLVERFQSWGFDAHIETFYVLMSTPNVRILEMKAPYPYVAPLDDGPFPGAAEHAPETSLPPYNAYSNDGDVTAEAVYVNYGRQEDYDLLARHGIDVKDKIVIARYGRMWRGSKPRIAAKNGAAAIILFSDPADAGYAEGAVYPDGPFLPARASQRGAVSDITRIAGDPLTPGQGANVRPESLSLDQAAEWISPIPVQPVSAAEIEPIITAMGGMVAPEDWRGGLPATYRIGDKSVKLRLKIAQNWAVIPLYDVVAVLEGSTWPDEWVLRGNNHDGWNFGAADSLSGLAALLEEARAIGEMAKAGERPKRTLVYFAWDGEEEGLLGSTEWVETHDAELRKKAVAYLNSGPTSRGFFSVGGSHSLRTFVDQLAHEVRDPVQNASIYDRVAAKDRLDQLNAKTPASEEALNQFPLGPLGLGSDYGAFLHHVGIASLDFTFEGEANNGCYHSICDNFSQYEKFSDPGFFYSAALSEAGGRMMLRLANADILPFDFAGMAEAAAEYVRDVEDSMENIRSRAIQRNTAIADGVFRLATDPQSSALPPKPESVPPEVDFTPLHIAVAALSDSAERLRSARADFTATTSFSVNELAQINAILRHAEQTLAPLQGLPRRPWYRHMLYAPDVVIGYEASTLPSLREAIEHRDWDELNNEIVRAADAINAYAQSIDRAAALLDASAL